VQNNGGKAPAGYKGGRTFMNDGRGGGQVLPQTDATGQRVSYREYDVNPFQSGVNRGPERIVIGSDGSAYYTSNHYGTFDPFP
jgi:guanyl-specific ribonuclease Sa